MRTNMNEKCGLTLTAIAAVLMAVPAFAQVDPDCTGSNPGTVTCAATTYADGITHTVTGGDLTVNVGGATSFGTGGFVTTATGDSSVTMTKGNGSNMATNASGTAASTVIGATTENGDISITTGTGNVAGVNTAVQYGIRAVSSGSGDINVVTGAAVNAPDLSTSPDDTVGIDTSTQGGDITLVIGAAARGRAAAVRAHANGGDISISAIGTSGNITSSNGRGIEAVTTGNIDITLGEANSVSSVRGVQHSVFTDTRGGTGTTLLNLSRNVLEAPIEALTGTGTLTINVVAPDPQTNVEIERIVTSGAAQGMINIGEGQTTVAVGSLDLSPDAGAIITINNRGAIGDGLRFSGDPDRIWGQGAGAGDLVFVNDGLIRGAVDFSGSGSVAIFNNTDRPLGNPRNGGWKFGGVNTFGSGGDQLVNTASGTLMAVPGAAMNFGAGEDVLVNDGRFIVGEGLTSEGVVTLSNLERFENDGLLIMGAIYQNATDLGRTSNQAPGTRLLMPGVNFVAGENSRIALDAALAELAQPDCTTAEAADCVDFTGGTTSGTTLLTLSDARPAVSSAAFNEGMVIIQGASAAEHFVLDPNSRGYVANTSTGPAIQKGLVTYRFTYDEAAKQHTLTGVLADEGAQGGTFMALAQEVWRTSADTWFDRQAQLRSSSGGSDRTAGLWTTLNVNRGERDLMRSVNIGGNAYDYNLQQDIAITHLAFGGDILRGTTDAGAWNFGGTAGYVFSTVDYDATQLELEVGGFAAGFYGSYLAGPLSVDGLLNYTFATQSLESTNMGLGPDTRLRSDYSTLGARVDVAWKLAFGEALYLQPLASVSKSSTDADDMEVPNDGGSFQFDGDSTRLGVGFRTGVQSRLLGLNTGVDLTARWWNESDAENKTVVTIPNGNTATALTDDFGGDFTELALGLNLSNDSGAFSGFINLKSQMATDYDMVGASAGFRFQW
mgnify:CR=1 FL=1|jgi:hypothetical protein